MTSRSTLTYGARAAQHQHPLARTLFELAETKKSNIILSADMTSTADLLDLAARLGPYIALLKTHIDIISDFSDATIQGLKSLSQKHNFLIFEDRKFIDIGTTVQKQYHSGALRMSECAHIVNTSLLAGDGIVEALSNTAASDDFGYKNERGLLLLAEMTTKGSLATGEHTQACIESARRHSDFVIGFVATRALTQVKTCASEEEHGEDFVVFTTGVNRTAGGDCLGQQYQTPKVAILGGSDFIIAGRGMYGADDPMEEVKLYREEGWQAYLKRVKKSQTVSAV